MENNKLTDLIIENRWLNQIIVFMKKATKMDDKSFELIVNGSKPELSERLEKEIEEESKSILESLKEENEEKSKEEKKD